MNTKKKSTQCKSAAQTVTHPALLPIGAMLLATSLGVQAQNNSSQTLGTVTVKEQAEPAEIQSKSTLRATESNIGKGKQQLRDIPQTVTVMTEMLMDDRNMDDFREVLKNTAGVTFLAGETGEEDVRLRGFSLGQAGDIYRDGLRDAPLVERDTFNEERVEVLKGSASMLFGKGSTGGVVNQVSKQPFLMDQHEVEATVGSGKQVRLTGDFNIKTDEDAALRINAVSHQADNWGAKQDKKGAAVAYRWNIGLRNEFAASLYHLETDGRPLYNHPWFLSEGNAGTIQPTLPAKNYYGLASDYLKTQSTFATLSHTHRFDRKSELKTTVRHGEYERDLVASVIRFCGPNPQNGSPSPDCPSVTNALSSMAQVNNNTVLTRAPKGRIGKSELTQVQSDFTNEFEALGKKHELIAGVDLSHEKAKRNQSWAEPPSGLTTTVGNPNNGDTNPNKRAPAQLNDFTTKNIGVYAQDTVHLTEQVKVVGGLRFDRFEGKYVANTCSPQRVTEVAENLWSPRLGVIFQPNQGASYYASVGTSYNVSGDTYAHANNICSTGGAQLAKTPPEKSRNFEIGGKFDVFNNKATVGLALFHSEKYNERNNDEPTAETMLLSGKRSATGMELNLAGQISPKWDIFYNHTWIPSAEIDKSNVALANHGRGAQVEGDRPALTPKHSASLWTTYRLDSQWRVGAGLNYRGKQNPEGARHFTAKAFTTVDAMAEYMVNDKTTVKFNVKNLTDELYADSLYRGFYAPGAPRTFQVSLKHQF
jgi:catecholate siderophore receptor